MPDPDSAADHLRVIRNLMERATVYRLISAPTAFIGGLATLLAALLSWLWTPSGPFFLLPWLLVLVLTLAANGFFMFRDARRRSAPVFSAASKHALISTLPALLAGLGVGALSLRWSYLHPGAFWCLFYGLALLATRAYSPPSMQRLAWLFFFTGLFSLIFLPDDEPRSPESGALFMAFTFGLFHLAYGVLVGSKTRFRLSGSAS